MESKNIIILLLIIIVVLAAALGVMFLSSSAAKQDTKLTITSNDALYEGDNLTVRLCDINGTGISDESVNVTITDSEGVSSYFSVETNSKGVGVLKLDNGAGNYTVNCTYAGNDNYTANSITQKLEIIEEIIEEPAVSQSTASYSAGSQSSESDNRPAVDSGGITREEADYYGWKYTPEHGGHYHGSRDAWDEEAGVYHD